MKISESECAGNVETLRLESQAFFFGNQMNYMDTTDKYWGQIKCVFQGKKRQHFSHPSVIAELSSQTGIVGIFSVCEWVVFSGSLRSSFEDPALIF